MKSVRLFLGALLFAASSASAQRVVLPVEGLGAASFSPVVQPAIAPAFLAPNLSAPSLQTSLIPALPAPPLVAAQAPVAEPLKLTAMSAAVADFGKIDLKNARAAEARGAADELMARVMGAPAAEPRSLVAGALPAPEIPLPPSSQPGPARTPKAPRVHLLAKTLNETVELGPVARVLHYTLEPLFQVGKALLAWHATGSVSAGLGVLAFEFAKMPAMITAQSLMDLGVRYWARKLKTLKEIANVPGVTRIRVLTTGDAEFSGILARRQENTGLIFVDADAPLPREISKFGEPIPVKDVAERRVRLVLEHENISDVLNWTPTLGQLLTGQALPAEIAAVWRERLDADKKDKTPLQRLFDFSKEKHLRLEAHLSDGQGGETPLGTMAFGRSVKRLVGIGRWDRVRALFGAKPVTRAIGLSDTTVERGGVKSVGGWARRLWLRLTGRLIVRP
jgi:hypothetical protein